MKTIKIFSSINKSTHTMNMGRSMHHNIYGLTVNKTRLSPLDTKRYIAPDGITTYAYGFAAPQHALTKSVQSQYYPGQ